MKFTIDHMIRYSYSAGVFLEPHTIRMRPRQDGTQRLLDFSLHVDPIAAGRFETIDPEGNSVTHVWFEDLSEELIIEARMTVETLCENPFGFIIFEPRVATIPDPYPGEVIRRIEGYTRPRKKSGMVQRFARTVAEEAGWKTIDFLTALSRKIHETCHVIFRKEGEPYPPEKTLRMKEGSCRDLAVLFIEACRHVGLAARFASGYQEARSGQRERELHAWAEVYLIGGGWRGFDPTQGLAVAHRHVTVAASLDPKMTAPVTGSFRGSNVVSSMDYTVRIDARA